MCIFYIIHFTWSRKQEEMSLQDNKGGSSHFIFRIADLSTAITALLQHCVQCNTSTLPLSGHSGFERIDIDS